MKSTVPRLKLWQRSVCRLLVVAPLIQIGAGQSVARQWNEDLLSAIRIDFPAPNVHARNLYHVSAAMYDAWAAYDATAVGVFHNEEATDSDVEAARAKAISFAAYRVLTHRATKTVQTATATIQALYDARMTALGYNTAIVTVVGTSPEAVGNRCAAAVIARGDTDGSNEANNYVDNTSYMPVNGPLELALPGVGFGVVDPKRWQPLKFADAQTQNGLDASDTQVFIGAHWGYVRPFALTGANAGGLYEDYDPGLPPYLTGDGGVSDLEAKAQANEVIEYSGRLDAGDGVMIDISPGAIGNTPLGSNTGIGHSMNPVTSAPYASNDVKRGDYGRVIAEFWADGPDSETPPGHWNTLANEAFDHPDFERKLGGVGAELNELEWDVKAYLALNASLHDTAVAAWGVKRHYDYVRPITLIRYLAIAGQSSDDTLQLYDTQGLQLQNDVTRIDSSSGLGGLTYFMSVRSWGVGEELTFDENGMPVSTETTGVDWRPGIVWIPYQRSTFVTPAFAGYVSGHSAFSRAAAEVLTGITGSPFFPGGLGTHTFAQDELEFESGPTENIVLQWATYYDAADEAGNSRVYGGIHVRADDLPGRIMGSQIGIGANARAMKFFDGSILDDFQCKVVEDGAGVKVSWPCVANYRYQLESSPTPDFTTHTVVTVLEPKFDEVVTYDVPTQDPVGFYYRVRRLSPAAPPTS